MSYSLETHNPKIHSFPKFDTNYNLEFFIHTTNNQSCSLEQQALSPPRPWPWASWWWWWSSSWSLSSSSKGFCLWKIQHFLELFFCMNSLSTVPSFQVTCFFFRLSFNVRVCGCWLCDGDGDDDEASSGFSSVTVVVTVADGEPIAALAAAKLGGLAMAVGLNSILRFFPFVCTYFF